MATANPYRPGSQRRRLKRLVALVLLALVIAAVWFWPALNGYARIGSAYGARVACSCRFEGGRSLSDCREDFEPGMELVMLSENADSKSVTARFPLLASETARYRKGAGCQLDPWRE